MYFSNLIFERYYLKVYFLFLGSTFSWEGINVGIFFGPKMICRRIYQSLATLFTIGILVNVFHYLFVVGQDVVVGQEQNSYYLGGNKTAKQNLNQPPSQTGLLSSLSYIYVYVQ